MNEIVLKIEGMHCNNCCQRIANVLNKIDGVEEVNVSLEDKEAVVKTSKDVSKELLKEKIENLDFKVIDD